MGTHSAGSASPENNLAALNAGYKWVPWDRWTATAYREYDDKAAAGGFGSSQWMIGHAIKPHDLLGYGTGRPDISGPELEPWLKRAARHLGNMTLVCEDIALRENRITLSDKVDSDGIPYAHTHHDLAPRAATRWTQRMAEGEEIIDETHRLDAGVPADGTEAPQD